MITLTTLARLFVGSVAALSLSTLPLLAADPARPNIILILADDLGYGDCSAYNLRSKIKTPNIDQLAKEGLRFTDAHSAASTCTPSRYGLLTGINPARTRVLNTLLSQGKPIISRNEKTIAHLLREQGYRTQMIGKWHLGFDAVAKEVADPNSSLKGGPIDCGFDHFFGIRSSSGDYPFCYLADRKVVARPTERSSWQKSRNQGPPITVKGLKLPGIEFSDASPTFCRKAIESIREHATSQNKQPLFLYYASPIPHAPWVPTDQFRGKSGLGDYADFVLQLDDVVGQINTALKETGLAENTFLIFTSDNGPGPHATQIMKEAGHATAGSLRGSKADIWEGGHRIPFIAKWPGKIPASKICTTTINFTDFFATLADHFKLDLTSKYPSAKDSHSFLPALLDPTAAHTRPAMINGYYSIRQGDWKLLTQRTQKRVTPSKIKAHQFLLHHLATDFSEQENLSENRPDKVKELSQKLENFIKQQQPK